MVEEKLGPLFNSKEVLSEDEASKMGRKDPEQEVEKFVSANTQELGKDKWLCPLSGKKFKVCACACACPYPCVCACVRVCLSVMPRTIMYQAENQLTHLIAT